MRAFSTSKIQLKTICQFPSDEFDWEVSKQHMNENHQNRHLCVYICMCLMSDVHHFDPYIYLDSSSCISKEIHVHPVDVFPFLKIYVCKVNGMYG